MPNSPGMAPRPQQASTDQDGRERAYRVILEADPDDGGFVVYIPAFPRAHTQGKTVDDALANAREVIELEIEVALQRGSDIPPPDAAVPIRVERVVITPLT